MKLNDFISAEGFHHNVQLTSFNAWQLQWNYLCFWTFSGCRGCNGRGDCVPGMCDIIKVFVRLYSIVDSSYWSWCFKFSCNQYCSVMFSFLFFGSEHGAMRYGQISIMLLWWCHQILYGFHLPRVSHQSGMSANYRDENKVQSEVVQVSWNLSYDGGRPGKTTWWMLCNQLLPQMGSLIAKWRR